MSFRIEVHWEWSGAIVSDGEQSLRVFTMLLGPALSDLTQAVIRLLRDVEHTTAFGRTTQDSTAGCSTAMVNRCEFKSCISTAHSHKLTINGAHECSMRSAVSLSWLARS